MTTLELARLQFGVTTIFHFIFVPISIGLASFVALCETLHYRTGKEVYLRMTRFWGRLMLLSVAIGVVTGIVQEFQFGMNWSQYSRYVGDIFGAPLAMEGLAAFFLESTFIGLWIFGWKRLSPKLHLMCAWLLAFGTMLSAYFILAANSWMQHPVGYRLVAGKAELTSIWKVLTNSTVLWAFPHTILGAFATAGMVAIAVCAWALVRGRANGVHRRSIALLVPITAVAAIATAGVGHGQGVLMEKQQPMKMAAAEALYNTKHGASFSIWATGPFTRHPTHLNTDVRIPHALSLFATGTWNGKVEGINQVNAAEQKKYGPGDYVPIVGVTYWSFRLMIGTGTAIIVMTLLGAFFLWRRTIERRRWWLWLAVPAGCLGILANWFGWIFTEMGRQPWVVYGLLRTNQANSPTVGHTNLIITLVGYTLVYGVLIAIGGWIFTREVGHGPEPDPAEPGPGPFEPAREDELVLAY
jgi:cytochrome d ubiquinol oxidase subunit I